MIYAPRSSVLPKQIHAVRWDADLGNVGKDQEHTCQPDQNISRQAEYHSRSADQHLNRCQPE